MDTQNNDTIPYFDLKDYETIGTYYRNYDGDSIDLIFPFPNYETKYKWKCRLQGLDTPEIRTKNSKEKEMALLVKQIVKQKLENKTLLIKCNGFDKYGRVLTYIYTPYCLDLDGKSLNEWLIENKYAKEYDGSTKEKWIFD